MSDIIDRVSKAVSPSAVLPNCLSDEVVTPIMALIPQAATISPFVVAPAMAAVVSATVVPLTAPLVEIATAVTVVALDPTCKQAELPGAGGAIPSANASVAQAEAEAGAVHGSESRLVDLGQSNPHHPPLTSAEIAKLPLTGKQRRRKAAVAARYGALSGGDGSDAHAQHHDLFVDCMRYPNGTPMKFDVDGNEVIPHNDERSPFFAIAQQAALDIANYDIIKATHTLDFRRYTQLTHACWDLALPLLGPVQAPRQSGKKMRHARRKRRVREFANIADLDGLLADLINALTHKANDVLPEASVPHWCDWDRFADETTNNLDPASGGVPFERAQRKRLQVEVAISWALALLPPSGGTAIEFCAGGGHLGLVLAFLRPDVKVVLVDKKPESISLAQGRADAMGLNNVTCYCGDMRSPELMKDLSGFDVGLGMHACGPATDAIQQLCITLKAHYVLIPCCYGFIQRAIVSQVKMSDGEDYAQAAPDLARAFEGGGAPLTFPRSEKFKEMGVTEAHFNSIAGRADTTYADKALADVSAAGRDCMRAVDVDRSLCAEENGYVSAVVTMTGAGMKNHCIIGRKIATA